MKLGTLLLATTSIRPLRLQPSLGNKARAQLLIELLKIAFHPAPT
ncbi:hypothetical protein FDUTEX481_04721 [Tolypothrix sp. PCC 7601]|nr:hypothetical protein FDUTEX481_04721 [Tolypothrix sp. PCC 7601]